ncbi:hypothetical protein QMZ92_06015 [Streptomyces sp. HNM0645]|uniref:hypothetical protein n=1 Tax=Streptomyces sp. HNM0645 TaxID=2782343 RepID=UPI0024B708BC|nr:hypothetical protein [Streptomyces sp. HNM0645]MDI9883959.1 hypothetical protein [Streptomyces sp. HNM0645]
MSMSTWKRVGVSLTAVAVVAGVAGCQDGDEGGKKKAADSPRSAVQSQGEITKVIQAAYKKTADAKSAKVRMTMAMPAGMEGGGTMVMSGVQGWNPGVMDVTVKGSMLTAGNPDAPSQVRMVMVDQAMYMEMGAKQAAEMDGKRWMKMDFKAAAEASGDKALQKQMTGSLENMNQDPAQQLALLLGSPSIKHVGAEKVDGVETQHYKGTLTFQEILDANESLDVLSAEERKELVAGVKKAGITGYDTEVWVNEDDYPVKMVVGMKMPQGTMTMTANYSDYGAAATVQAPPAKDTFDLFKMLKELEGSGAEGGPGLDG